MITKVSFALTALGLVVGITALLPMADWKAGWSIRDAEREYHEGNFDKVIELTQEKIALDGTDRAYYKLNIEAKIQAGRLDEAAATIELLLSRYPGDQEAMEWKREIWRRREWPSLRREALKAADQRNWRHVSKLLQATINFPDMDIDRETLLAYLEANFELEQYEESNHALARLIHEFPVSSAVQEWQGILSDPERGRLIRTAQAALQREHWKVVFDTLKEKMSHAPYDDEISSLYLRACLELQEIGEMENIISHLAHDNPDNSRLKYWRGVLYSVTGRELEAIEILTEVALSVEGEFPEIYLHLGQAYMKSHSLIEGCAALVRYTEIGKDERDLSLTREAIDRRCDERQTRATSVSFPNGRSYEKTRHKGEDP